MKRSGNDKEVNTVVDLVINFRNSTRDLNSPKKRRERTNELFRNYFYIDTLNNSY